MILYKDSLISETNAYLQAKQNKDSIQCFPSSGRCSVTSWKAELCKTWQLLGKANTITSNILSSSFTQLCAEHNVQKTFGNSGSSLLADAPPSFLLQEQSGEKEVLALSYMVANFKFKGRACLFFYLFFFYFLILRVFSLLCIVLWLKLKILLTC